MMKGRLVEMEKRRAALDVEAKGDIALIRMLLNPYEPDVARLETGRALAAMQRLARHAEEMRGLAARIAELREALDG